MAGLHLINWLWNQKSTFRNHFYIRRAIRKASCWETQRSGPPEHQILKLKALSSYIIKNYFLDIHSTKRHQCWCSNVFTERLNHNGEYISWEGIGYSPCVSAMYTHLSGGLSTVYSVRVTEAFPPFVEEEYNSKCNKYLVEGASFLVFMQKYNQYPAFSSMQHN